MPISRPFAVASEGQTIDGRNISREQIQQMAAHYDPKVYTAVANLEHLLSYAPESVFSSYGKVVSLTTQETELMGDKKLQLMAVVDASESIVAMQKAGKKAFASIEIASNFLNKGIAYMSGLAFTDTPASIGTESMKFSANKESIYSFGNELSIEWVEESKQDSGESLFSKVKDLLSFGKKDTDARFTDIGHAVEAVAVSQKDLLEKFSTVSDELKSANEKFAELSNAAEKDRAAFAALSATVEKLSALPNSQGRRPSATGNEGAVKTDC